MLSEKVIRAIKESGADYTELNEQTIKDIYIAAGLPDDAAEWMQEWCPEYVGAAMDNVYYTYGFDNGILYFKDEKEFNKHLDYHDLTVDSDDLTYFVDAAFEGYIVVV